ncbi:MAG: histone deacetylase [Anaerolineales bacterium]
MTTAFFTDKHFAAHTQPGHPEHAGRLEAVVALLQDTGTWQRLAHLADVMPATDEQILAVHTARYLKTLAATANMQYGTYFGADTYLTPQSYNLARLAAGGTLAVVDAVLGGEAQNGIAAIRPPGHHATPQTGMGFCLLSNIAMAARHALARHGLQRVAIVDYDVHHGNGTQDCLYDDPRVLFISSHQAPLYPGTGAIGETGRSDGRGYTVNIPLPAATGDDAFATLYADFVRPILARYAPQLLLVSAGFDAHWVDPLAGLSLSLAGYDQLCRLMLQAADDVCEGKVIFVMEGGYDLQALSHGWLNIARRLLGDEALSDPLGLAPMAQDLPDGLLERLREQHRLA